MSGTLSFEHVTYVRATPEQVWHALTDAELTGRFWGHRNESDWQPGSEWRHVRTDGSGIVDVVGTVVAAEPPELLVLTFGEGQGGPVPTATLRTERHHDIVRITLRHDGLPTPADLDAASAGWPAVLANLKTLLETGDVLPQAPWEMHAELRAAQLESDAG